MYLWQIQRGNPNHTKQVSPYNWKKENSNFLALSYAEVSKHKPQNKEAELKTLR